jgi:hypothetical protein
MTKSSRLILSNEDKLIQEEKERLRKLRIIQVREISKQNAAQLRNAFKKEQEKGIKNLLRKSNSLKSEEHRQDMKQMQNLVESHLDQFGNGHQLAQVYDDKAEEKERQKIENKEMASLRGKFALDIRREEKKDQENKENAHIIARQFALEQEKLRSAQIAKLPPIQNSNDIIETEQTNKKKPGKMVSYHDANAFSTTRYHMPDSCVDKPVTTTTTLDARKQALNEANRLELYETDQIKTNQERMEKARLRGKHALEKEMLNENYNDILIELNQLEKADREKRQKELLNIPKEIFLPAWQRQQEKNEVQIELEREFEKIYADSNLRAEKELPQPVDLKQLDLLSQSGDADLDLTLVDDTLNKSKSILYPQQQQQQLPPPLEVIPEPEICETLVSQPVSNSINSNVSSTNASNGALTKLLEKIRKQREDISLRSVEKCENESVAAAATTNAEKSIDHESSDLWSTPNSSIKLNDEQPAVTNETTSSFDLSNDDEEEEKETLNKNTEKLTKKIMMSSHNVSSLNDLESNLNKRYISSSAINNKCPKKFNNNPINLSQVTASRDQMIAGPRELFNENDAKLAIELKRKELELKQEELEKRLQLLKEQEQAIKAAAALTTATSSSSCIDSGNDHNYHTDSVDNNSTLASNSDDLKRIEYQQMILKSASEKQMKSNLLKSSDIETSSECSTSYAASTNIRIEERKKEILKRFGINQSLLTNKKPPVPPAVTAYSSADSGVSSLSTNTTTKTNKKQSLEVEHLKQQQNDQDLLAYLSTSNLDKDDLLRRLSSGSLNMSEKCLFGLEFFESPEIRDVSVEKLIGWKLNQKSLDDTLNDGDTTTNTTSSSSSNNSHEDSQDLIVSLLNSRNKVNDQKTVDLKRQLIQDQLDIVRKKKDQLTKMDPRIKSINNNLHELSTIKEVDTPISERNLKLNQNKYIDISAANQTISFLENSSLENVTQLTNNNNNNKSNSMSDTSTPMHQQQQDQLLSINTMRQKQMQLFDASLFEYSSSVASNSQLSPQNNNNNALSKNMSSMKLTEYGAMIYDELSSNNLSTFTTTAPLLANAVSMNSTSSSYSSSNKKNAFKTEEISNDLNMLKKNKKWFDILATTSSDDDTSASLLSQHPINNSSNNSQTNNNTSYLSSNSIIQISESSQSIMKQYPIDSSMSQQSSRLERTLNQYKSPPKKLSNSNGLFDRFIKSYNSQQTSVQDEPELSFVSYKTVSNPVSPQKKANYSINTTASTTTTTTQDSNLSLIHFQQKQLNKQFANLSPIELNQNSNNNDNKNKLTKSMSTVDFTLFESKNNDDFNESQNETTNSLALFSPDKNNDTNYTK